MKIMLLNTWRVINAKGGTEKVFAEMGNELTHRGHSVLAVCNDYQSGKPGFYIDPKVQFLNLASESDPWFFCGLAKNLSSFSLKQETRIQKRIKFQARKLCFKLKKHLLLFNPNVIISFQPLSTYALKQLVGNKVPIITMLHNKPIVYLPPSLPKFVKDAVADSTFVQVLRPEFVKDVKAILPSANNIVVIPNCVRSQDKKAALVSKKIINVGRITDDKRQLLLIQSFNLIKDAFPEWTLEIWGEVDYDPDYTKKIKNYISSNNLVNRCHLRGTTDDVISKLMDASIFAFPSRYEGWGLALTEAMSLGLPSIGCIECPAVNTLIKSGQNGILCDATAQSLADSMSLLIKNIELRHRLGSKASEDMLKYRPEIVWNAWDKLIHEAYLALNTK